MATKTDRENCLKCVDLRAWIWIVPVVFMLGACERFFDPVQELVIDKDFFFEDWSEYRAAEMGLYALQQNLVEQIVILGELRADLLELTPNADRDMIEVYNFQVTKDNKYASPANFFKLIGACNSLATQLESAHPEVMDENVEITDFDRLYGEVLCMRAWAYFNAVRIYGKVPYIWPSLTTIEEIDDYVNSGGEYVDTLEIVFDPGGYYNDTLHRDTTIILEKKFIDTEAVIDSMVNHLTTRIKAVGVLHNKDNNDASWEATVWTNYSRSCLLGQMFLFQGDIARAEEYFFPIMYFTDPETSAFRFGLDGRFQNYSWRNIFLGIDINEHIYTLWFNKSYQQQHELQNMFSVIPPNKYMLKPTPLAITKWEGSWNGMKVNFVDANPALTEVTKPGSPGDFFRGHGTSFAYIKGEEVMEEEDVREMLNDKRLGNDKNVETAMEGVDTVVFKYTIGKNSFDQDANFIVFRAAAVHLYYAEIYARLQFPDGGLIRTDVNLALNVLNDGSYRKEAAQRGVRGRVGFGDGDDAVYVRNVVYEHNPVTNEITGYKTFSNLLSKQQYMEDQIIEERARELAFEGERFYDLMRIAKRRSDPSYLADRVAAKFPPETREAIRIYLLDENNWYVPFF